ncbi:MAG: PEP-CTERM sorting domain-containing protein [Kiritimatiellales bacterium]
MVDGYRVGAKDHANGAGHWPTLTIQTIPEPGSMGLLVLGMLGTFCIRQFRKG